MSIYILLIFGRFIYFLPEIFISYFLLRFISIHIHECDRIYITKTCQSDTTRRLNWKVCFYSIVVSILFYWIFNIERTRLVLHWLIFEISFSKQKIPLFCSSCLLKSNSSFYCAKFGRKFPVSFFFEVLYC